MANFQLFFSVQGTDGSPTGPDPENRVRDQDNESPGRSVSSGLQLPSEPGIVVQGQAHIGQLPAAFFLQLHQQR